MPKHQHFQQFLDETLCGGPISIPIATSSSAVRAVQRQPTISKPMWMPHPALSLFTSPAVIEAYLHALTAQAASRVLTKPACLIAGTNAAQRPDLHPLQTANQIHKELNSMGNSAEGQHQHLPGLLSDQQVPQASALGQVHTHPATAGAAPRPTGRWSHMGTLQLYC